MASWQAATWESSVTSGLSRRDRAHGPYRTYHPDLLTEGALLLDPESSERVARAEAKIHGLTGNLHDLEGVARFLLRSEAIASSRIEGVAPAARQVALAELSDDERVSISRQAQLVANNMTIIEDARAELVASPKVSVGQLVALQAALLADEPTQHGVRRVQNWIGGSAYNPLDAQFVPPPPNLVPGLLDDLVTYLNGASHSGVIQAALVHAQFETIHPFVDGNGRVGRALIHTVLTRRGLTPRAILPISQVLATFSDRYIAGLMAYHHDAEVNSPAFHAARAAWITVFADAVIASCEQATRLNHELAELREEWDRRLGDARAEAGLSRTPRKDSATTRILRDLPATPVLSAQTVQRIHDVSPQAANQALDELTQAGVLTSHKRGTTRFYQATEVLALVDSAERRLASTQFDTLVSPPTRPVPEYNVR